MVTILQELRFAFRTLRKSHAFTAVAVLTMALGIGVNTAIFSLVNAVLLQPLPFRNADQLVVVREASQTDRGFIVSALNFEDYRRQTKTFDQLSLWINQSVNLTGNEKPDRVVGAFASDNFFQLMDVPAYRGRTFAPGDDLPGAEPVVLVSYGTWQSRYGGRADLVGQKIILNNNPSTVVGILTPDFVFPLADSDVWLPIQRYPNYKRQRDSGSGLLIGRVKANLSLHQATDDLQAALTQITATAPKENVGKHIEITTLKEVQVQALRPTLFVLLATVLSILLISSANLANLLLVRGLGRMPEMGVRLALGARRMRLIGQLLTESLLVALAGGIAGLLLASWGIKLLLQYAPVSLPPGVQATVSTPVFAFALGLSLLTGLVAGLFPALQVSGKNLRVSVASSGRATANQAGQQRMRTAFVVAQVALSCMLLVGSVLLTKTLHQLATVHPGFEPKNLLTMEYRLPINKYPDTTVQWNFHRTMLERVQHVPGVTSAALVQALPFSGNGGRTEIAIPGAPPAAPGQGPTALLNLITPDYFNTVGVPVLQGRTFNDHDSVGAPPVVIVNRTLAEKYWPGQSPVGKSLDLPNPRLAAGMGGGPKSATVVGVVGDTKQYALRDESDLQVYFPYAQVTGIFGTLVIKTAVDPMSLTKSVQNAVWSVDKDQPVWKIRTMEFLLQRDVAPDRTLMYLMLAFGALALLLTCLGTYGVVSYTVAQRTREIGVRVALGALPSQVVGLILRQGVVLAVFGALIGIAGALAGAQLLSKLLYGVRPRDPLSLALAAGLVIIVTLAGCFLPARKAARIDPLVALRHE